jgi:hypothetical protein
MASAVRTVFIGPRLRRNSLGLDEAAALVDHRFN